MSKNENKVPSAEEIFIEKWNVGYEDKEQKLEFANEIRSELKAIIRLHLEALAKEMKDNLRMIYHDGRTKENREIVWFQNGADNIQLDKKHLDKTLSDYLTKNKLEK
jgi:hypothetical protein